MVNWVELLKRNRLVVIGNGFAGTTDLAHGLRFKDDNRNFETTLSMAGEPADRVYGSIDDRRIMFNRTRPGSFEQTYDGWFFVKTPDDTPLETYKGVVVAGLFSHNGPVQWSWYGKIAELSP